MDEVEFPTSRKSENGVNSARVKSLLYGYGFGEISRLVYIRTFKYSNMVRQQLHGDHINKWRNDWMTTG